MKYIDMHCDTLMQLRFKDSVNHDLYDSKLTSVDFKRMKKGEAMAQFFAAYVPPQAMWQEEGIPYEEPLSYLYTLQRYLLENVKGHEDQIAMAYSGYDVEKNDQAGRMSAILAMEDGVAIEGQMERIREFYDLGYRAITLTHNFANSLGYPNTTDHEKMQLGLTDFGKEAVVYMQELGVLVDVSHLSDGGFYDVAKLCKKPFIATHSNARSLSPHPRNMTDEMLKLLGNAGGVTGVNFFGAFLNQDTEDKRSTIAAMVEHMKYMVNLAGIESVGLGSDLDGITGDLEIDECDKIQLLIPAMEQAGFTASDMEKIFYKNVLRVMKEAMK